jgi:hypothetical protein
MRKAPSLLHERDITRALKQGPFIRCDQGGMMTARPEGMFGISNRIRLAWLVLTGKADAYVWPEDEKERIRKP